MKKCSSQKFRNGVFVLCDNDYIIMYMYGKSVLSMSMTCQKAKGGGGTPYNGPYG